MVDKEIQLAKASFGLDGSAPLGYNNFYMPSGMDALYQSQGLAPEKLMVPTEYHALIKMCHDFYMRAGMASVVMDRLAELTITDIRNSESKSEEAEEYYEAVLHRKPSRLMRFIRTISLEYYLTGMVLPRVDWQEMPGSEISPKLRAGKIYSMPSFDLYPPMLVEVAWAGWGNKEYFLKIPNQDIKLVKSKGGKIKEQQLRYQQYVERYPWYVDMITQGENRIKLNVDPILRKETSLQPYPTPYLAKVLEPLVFKQQLRRMDFSVAARIVNAILLIQEGDKDFPLTEDTRSNLDELKTQILGRANDPRLMERLFMLFSNHTTKLTWIMPDVEALLNQDKYRQANEEIQEGLGFSRILVVGESRNSNAAELSVWSIQPQMEELRSMIIEWMTSIYEEAAELNRFRYVPEPKFTPIKLQDFVKTAAVFAQAFREGNVSRTTRDQLMGLDFETELQLMTEEYELMQDLPKKFPELPYNVQLPTGGMIGPNNRNGGRPAGSQNAPITKRDDGTKPKGQAPVSRLRGGSQPTKSKAASVDIETEIELWPDEDVINLIDKIARDRGFVASLESLNME